MNRDKYTLEEFSLDVGDGHLLYAQLWGSKKRKTTPIISVHGGPGSGSNDSHKTLFDPEVHTVLFYDQRGAGNSTPLGSLESNTTDHLVADIDKLAEKVGFNKFALSGGSWGSTLALTYSIKNPQKVSALYLRGIFLARKTDISYLDSGEFRKIFPDLWEDYKNSAPKEYKDNPTNYHKKNMSSTTKQKDSSAFEYAYLEHSLLRLDDRRPLVEREKFDAAGTLIERYFMDHECFLPKDYILKNAHKISAPVFIVQGRYDSITPPIGAWELHKKLPSSILQWAISGHSGSDRESWSIMKAFLARHE